jgi:hypothetical protein
MPSCVKFALRRKRSIFVFHVPDKLDVLESQPIADPHADQISTVQPKFLVQFDGSNMVAMRQF